MNIYLDIETLPCADEALKAEIAAGIAPPGNYKKAETIAEWEKTEKPKLVEEALSKTGLDGGYGSVCCIGWAVEDLPITCRLVLPDDGERGLLEALINDLEAYANKSPVIAGHNVQFDLRFLLQRCAVNEVFPGRVLYSAMNAKPWDKCLADTMLMWHPQNKVSLTKLCKILGVKKDDPVDGSQVYDLWKKGDFKAIVDHCVSDVDSVRSVHRKLTFKKAA